MGTTRHDQDWDYWEKRRHERAHRENDPNGCGAALSLLFMVMLIFLLSIPLVIMVFDYYDWLACNSGWHVTHCDVRLIEWQRLKDRGK